MKYKIKKAKKDDPIYKKGFTISSIKDYFQSKKDRGLKPLFFEKIGDKNSSRDEKLQNLIKVLKANGWKIKKEDLMVTIKSYMIFVNKEKENQ